MPIKRLERLAPLSINAMMVLNMRSFQQSLKKVLLDEGAKTIARKMIMMRVRDECKLFKNEFLRTMIVNGP